jgi:hypothetical protein
MSAPALKPDLDALSAACADICRACCRERGDDGTCFAFYDVPAERWSWCPECRAAGALLHAERCARRVAEGHLAATAAAIEAIPGPAPGLDKVAVALERLARDAADAARRLQRRLSHLAGGAS